jgi:hypothetical protein
MLGASLTNLARLQKGDIINDQTFDSFALITNDPVNEVRTSRRRHGDKTAESRFAVLMKFSATLGTATSIVGFIMQFMGLRGMHWYHNSQQHHSTTNLTNLGRKRAQVSFDSTAGSNSPHDYCESLAAAGNVQSAVSIQVN